MNFQAAKMIWQSPSQKMTISMPTRQSTRISIRTSLMNLNTWGRDLPRIPTSYTRHPQAIVITLQCRSSSKLLEDRGKIQICIRLAPPSIKMEPIKDTGRERKTSSLPSLYKSTGAETGRRSLSVLRDGQMCNVFIDGKKSSIPSLWKGLGVLKKMLLYWGLSKKRDHKSGPI